MGVSQPLNEKVIKRVSLDSSIKKVTSECFATLSATAQQGQGDLSLFVYTGEKHG